MTLYTYKAILAQLGVESEDGRKISSHLKQDGEEVPIIDLENGTTHEAAYIGTASSIRVENRSIVAVLASTVELHEDEISIAVTGEASIENDVTVFKDVKITNITKGCKPIWRCELTRI